uniref:sulfite exporter TauE/SafE family protein 4-like n=1 Tax=Erigeron canadensis TaxID=72917 RepID=UPI001CB8A28A|nr:sulfite exporter TauE/SafE family protein 4-like [Erigeron canadensis]
MATKFYIFFLWFPCLSLLILSVYIITKHPFTPSSPNTLNVIKSGDKIWPELEFNWRLIVATIIGFLGSAFGTVGGVGGGGIFVPMLTLIVGFDTKSAAALSKCMIMGASTSSVWYNLRVPHPCREVPILDYDLALLFQPMLMLGITLGVALSVVFPYWLITILIILLFSGTSARSFLKATEMWKEETIMMKEMERPREFVNSRGELMIDTFEPLIPKEEKTPMQIFLFNLRWKMLTPLIVVWIAFLALQIIKNRLLVCSSSYWLVTIIQFPVALAVFGYECVKLYKESKRRKSMGNPESVCEAAIDWTTPHLMLCAFCGILGGTVGGLLGSGGGFILGPLLLEIGVMPQVASATATFVMMFSSSLSVVEFYLLKRFPIPFALYLMAVSVMAGFWGQFFIRRLIAFLKRASLIVFILSAVIFASAITMGVIGVDRSIKMIHNHEFMGFLQFCSSQ